LTQYHAPRVKSISENEPLVSCSMLLQIRPWASLVQTSSRVTRGTITNRATLRRVSHFSRPVYCSARANHITDTLTMPRYSTLAQKTWVGKSALPSSKAYPSAHSATASMSNASGVAPDAGRRRQEENARVADTAAAMTKGNT